MYDQVTGSYTVFEGECEGKIEGSASYKKAGAETFLWASEAHEAGGFETHNDAWVLSSSCGSSDGTIAYGGYSPMSLTHPFVDVGSSWACGIAAEVAMVDIYIHCEAFEGDAAECIGGTWSETGTDCANCPSERPASEQGATSEDECEFCPPGSEAVDGNCVQCQAGSATSGGGVACQLCEAGSKAGVLLGAENCEACPGGFYSNVGAQECITCDYGEYSSAGAGACEQCPADRPASSVGSEEADCEADCVRLEVAATGCTGVSVKPKVIGHYRKYEGDCGNTDGRDSWVNEVTGYFLFWAAGPIPWNIGPICGGKSESKGGRNPCTKRALPQLVFASIHAIPSAGDGVVAFGNGGSYLQIQSSEDITWKCVGSGGGFVDSYVVIGCSIHQDEVVSCLGGTYDPSGSGAEGACTTCPPQLEISPENSTSVQDCYTAGTNLFVASSKVGSIVRFNGNSASFDLVKEGGALKKMGAMSFVTETLFLVVSDTVTGILTMMNVEGDVLGEFARVEAALGLLYLPDRRQVAVTSEMNAKKIFFFDLDDYKDGVRLEESDAVHVVYLNTAVPATTVVNGHLMLPGRPRHLSAGENDDEFLLTTSEGQVIRLCVPSSECKAATRNRILVQGNWDLENFQAVAISRSSDAFFYVSKAFARVSKCLFKSDSEIASLGHECPTFADLAGGRNWDPHGVTVDDVKQVVYVSDMEYSSVHVFKLDGLYLGPLQQTRGFLSQPTTMAVKPGLYAPLSSLAALATAVAGEEIAIPLTLRTSTADIYAATNETGGFQVSAAGFQFGAASTITGYIAHANSLLSVFLSIRAVGKWSVAITEGIKNPQHLEGSPFEIEIMAAETVPAECEAEFKQVLTAGDGFTLDVTTVDAFGNPTEGAEFEFSCCVGEVMTKTGEYQVSVTPAIKGSPFRFDVKPNDPDAATSTHNIATATEFISTKEIQQELRAFPKDEFGNAITDATGYAVSIDGDDAIPLPVPDFSNNHSIPADFEGEIELRFTLDGVNIKNSPVKIKVAPPDADTIKTEIVTTAFGVLTLVSLVLYRWQRKQAKASEKRLLTEQHSIQRSLSEQKNALAQQNENLQESLRKKKHSEDELEVMKAALDGLEKKQKDELNEVLICSSEVKVSRLLGKGGFGVVNLATYRGQPTAMKQLLTINDESVKRFR